VIKQFEHICPWFLTHDRSTGTGFATRGYGRVARSLERRRSGIDLVVEACAGKLYAIEAEC
jgi:hypothetical protein